MINLDLNVYIIFIVDPSLTNQAAFPSLMSDQTNCSVCQKRLNKNGIWCGLCGYVHVKCSGLKCRKDWTREFVCTHCVPTSTTTSPSPEENNLTPQAPVEPKPENFWSIINAENVKQLQSIYREVVHWRPRFFNLRKNKTCHSFVDTLGVICLLYTSPSPRDLSTSRMPSSA